MKFSYVAMCSAADRMRQAPVQVGREKSVPWDVSAEAWKEYAAEGHGDQSHERLCGRGGFGLNELAILLYLRCKRLEAASAPAPVESRPLDRMRAAGWMVAVHNDYRQGGETFTFWLLTHPSGRWVKGEGRTDDEALVLAESAAAPVESAPGACTCGNPKGAHLLSCPAGPATWSAPASTPAEPRSVMDVFGAVARREITPREGADILHPPAAEPGTCPVHKTKWIEGTTCPKCGGRRFWHSGMGETTTDEHQRCFGPCGMDRFVDGIDS